MSLMYCHNCKKQYGPTIPCPECGVMGERVQMTTNPKPDARDELDEILSTFASQVMQQGTTRPTTHENTRQLIESYAQAVAEERVDEHQRQLDKDVLATFLKILTKYGWEYGQDVKHDWALFRVPHRVLEAYADDPQTFFEQMRLAKQDHKEDE